MQIYNAHVYSYLGFLIYVYSYLGFFIYVYSYLGFLIYVYSYSGFLIYFLYGIHHDGQHIRGEDVRLRVTGSNYCSTGTTSGITNKSPGSSIASCDSATDESASSESTLNDDVIIDQSDQIDLVGETNVGETNK